MNRGRRSPRAFVAAAARLLVLFFAGSFLGAGPGGERARQADADARQPAPAKAPAAQLIRVPTPLAGEADTRLKAMIGELLARWQEAGGRPTLILEFGGGDEAAQRAGQFERALSLARFLAGADLGRIRTVAYLTGPVHGHAVLPVLACEQIITHPDAELGRAGLTPDAADRAVRAGYVEVAGRRRTIPEAVVLAMLDSQVAVFRVQTQDGIRYVLSDEVDRLQKQAAVRSVEQVAPAGQLVNLSGTELELQFGCQRARDRLQLAAALQLPVGSLEEDPTLGVGRRAVRADLTGPIQRDTVNWVERGIREKVEREQVNFVCLVIDSPGGSPADSMRLAGYLAGLAPQVRTVAFVASQARADAALVALACDQLLMTDKAVLGGPGLRSLSPRKSQALRTAVRELAKSKNIGWSLPLAMIAVRWTTFSSSRTLPGQAWASSARSVSGATPRTRPLPSLSSRLRK